MSNALVIGVGKCLFPPAGVGHPVASQCFSLLETPWVYVFFWGDPLPDPARFPFCIRKKSPTQGVTESGSMRGNPAGCVSF